MPLLAFGLILGPLTAGMVHWSEGAASAADGHGAADGKGFWSTFVWLRTSEALEAEALVEHRDYTAEPRRLRGVFFATLGAEEAQVEALFREAIRIAREQKSISLERRAQSDYAEYF